ncbi:MAG TPA: TolC family protein [Chthoniobacterales bacterium]|nr:TolC family protein [Chthoniobacterales bacterium]
MKTIYLLLLSTTLTLSVGAEPSANVAARRSSTGSLSLGDVTSAVLANNPAIQQALKKWAAAKAHVTQEAAWDDLRVSGSSRAARFIDVASNSFTDQVASVEQIIPLTGKNLVRARIAAADAVETFERARREQLDVLAKTRASYFRLANAYAQLEVNRKNLVSLRQIAEVSRSRYEVGKANAAEPLAGEVEASKLLESEQDILRNIAAEQSQLNVLMNRDAFAPLGQPQETRIISSDVSMDEARTLMLANRPEIKIAQAKIDMEKSRVDLSHRNWIPDPAIKVEAERYNDAGQVASELDAGVSFTVPWVNPGKYSAAVREAKANFAAAQHGFDQVNAESLGLLRDALQKVHTAGHHVELFRDKLLPQARQAFEANQFAYETGKASFLEWITAQHNLRDLEAMAQQHLADYYAALAELEAVVGVDLNLFPSTKTKEAK